jgi:phosphoribosylaminoimidazolecarboxamide formyltransferase / IMP cyclohydrolase
MRASLLRALLTRTASGNYIKRVATAVRVTIMKVERALLSVSDKFGIEDFAKGLAALNIELIATTGTRGRLLEEGLSVTSVADGTGFPDGYLGGRIKTFHPRLYAGILADRDNSTHMTELHHFNIPPIDLVCVNLYPFGETDQDEEDEEEAIAHIDIGGTMLLRGAALNHRHVAVIVRPSLYLDVLEALRRNDNSLSERTLGTLAAQAFAHVASYEAAVSAWFSDHFGQSLGPLI